jgi:hypothetical protein
MYHKLKTMIKKTTKFNTAAPSTYFRSPVLNSTKLDVDSGVIKGYAVCTEGMAQGHELLLDTDFLQSVVDAGNANADGVVCIFGHASTDTEALSNILGYSKNFRLDGSTVRADLHLLSKAEKRDFVLALAAEMPKHFGASIAFLRNSENEDDYTNRNEGEAVPHARLLKLISCDIVKNPAANSSFFSTVEEKAKALNELQGDPELQEYLQSKESKVMDKPEIKVNEMERFNALNAKFSNRPEFVISAFTRGISVEQAEVELKDLKIKELEAELAKSKSGPDPVAFAADDKQKPDFLSQAKELAKEKKLSLKEACSIISRQINK